MRVLPIAAASKNPAFSFTRLRLDHNPLGRIDIAAHHFEIGRARGIEARVLLDRDGALNALQEFEP